MNAKPSEIRAASKAGRIAIKADRQKQQRMLMEQQESQMKMNKIRAEIEAIKEKERSTNGEGRRNTSSDTDGENGNVIQRDNESPQSQDSNIIICDDQLLASMTKIATAKNGSPPRRMIRRNKSSKQFERALLSKENLLISNPVPEMRRKASVRDLVFSLSDHQRDISKVSPFLPITPKGERKKLHPQDSQENPMAHVRRGNAIATTKASSTNKNRLAKIEEEKRKMEAQRNKLKEAKRCFEEGHRLCWRFQDSHSVSRERAYKSIVRYEVRIESVVQYCIRSNWKKTGILSLSSSSFTLTDDFTSLCYTIFCFVLNGALK
jgi:hypothetical protein